MAIDVKQAVDTAVGYFSKLMTVYDVRLEEVEVSGDDRFWYVTLSALVPVPKPPSALAEEAPLSALATLFKRDTERVYKIFTVDAVNGSVRSMKIRSVP